MNAKKCFSDRSYCSGWQFEKLRDNLSMFQFKLPAPVFGTFCNGHFDTFFQCIEKRGVGQNYVDEEQPTAVAKDLRKCVFCLNYSFSSKTEKERHIGMFHRRVKTSYKELTLKCSTCSSTFSTKATLSRQKLKEGHSKCEIATASTPKKKHQRKTKQRTINEMLHSHQNNTNDGNSDMEENASSSTNCQINSGNKRDD